MRTYVILLAEEHRLIREGLKRVIEERPGMKLVGESGNGPDFMNLIDELTPDMVIVDIAMSDRRGIGTHEIKSRFPDPTGTTGMVFKIVPALLFTV